MAVDETAQDARHTHHAESVYMPSDKERRALLEALDQLHEGGPTQNWSDVRAGLHAQP